MALDTFGKRLKMLRVDRGMSQIELRDKMEKLYGVSIGETYVSELERSSKMPSLEVAAAMARALEVSVDYLGLIIEDALPYKREDVTPLYFSPEADEVARLVDAMPQMHRAMIVSMLRGFASPLNEQQRMRANIKVMLESVEKNQGTGARVEMERRLREIGLYWDNGEA